jgi:hypothetical protein
MIKEEIQLEAYMSNVAANNAYLLRPTVGITSAFSFPSKTVFKVVFPVFRVRGWIIDYWRCNVSLSVSMEK